MSKENLKNRGITLIALIITIIVMLILTGVALTISLGDNGIVNKAQEASEEMQVAMDRELLLSAAIGAMGNDGKVNLSAMVLPEGFTGSNGTYTCEDGHTFTVSENGDVVYTGESDLEPEVETITLNGKYYFDKEQMEMYYEIRDNNQFGYGEEFTNIVIDEENQTISDTTGGEDLPTLSYQYVEKDGKIINVLLIDDDDYLILWQNQNGFENNLDGIYLSDLGNKRYVFDSETGIVTIEYYNSTNNSWDGNSSNSNYEGYYFEVNGICAMHGKGKLGYVSEDMNTITYYGTTYTKQ